MPSKFVTKLIGSGGSLIRDIAYKSGFKLKIILTKVGQSLKSSQRKGMIDMIQMLL